MISPFHPIVSFLLRVFRIQRHVRTLRCKYGILIKRPWRQLTPNYDGTRVLLAYSPDSTLRVADVYEDKVVIWDASRGEKLDTIEYQGKGRTEQCISTDGEQFAILTNDDIRVWRAGTPAAVAPHTVPNQVARLSVFLSIGQEVGLQILV